MTGMINKLLTMFEKFNIKRAAELVIMEESTVHPSESLVYDLETIILPDYQHLTTPPHVAEFLRELKNTPSHNLDRLNDNLKFCLDSLAYARRVEKAAKPIVLTSYWPSFNCLNQAQKKWYFYWRNEILSGNYLDTDSGYLLILVYELLNYTFNDQAAINLSMLDRLYKNYHNRDVVLARSALSYYLPKWISDFCYELGDYNLEKKWSFRVKNERNEDYETLKLHEQKLETVSIIFWKRYITYSQTKFFQANRNLVYKIFKASIAMLASQYQSQGQNLIEEWMPENNRGSIKRPLFESALIGRKTQNRLPVSRKPSRKMREDLTLLFRLAENISRIKSNEKRLLPIDESLLPQGFKNELIKSFCSKSEPALFSKDRLVGVRTKAISKPGTTIPNSPKIIESEEITLPITPILEFDFDRIETLAQASEELLKIFADKYADEPDPLDELELNKPEQHESEPNEIKPTSLRRVPKIQVLPDSIMKLPLNLPLMSCDEDTEQFISELSELERTFLLGFSDLQREASEGMQVLKAQGMMMGVFLSTLNEKSLNILGDNLVEQDGEVVRFNEDLEQVLFRLAKGD